MIVTPEVGCYWHLVSGNHKCSRNLSRYRTAFLNKKIIQLPEARGGKLKKSALETASIILQRNSRKQMASCRVIRREAGTPSSNYHIQEVLEEQRASMKHKHTTLLTCVYNE